MARDDDRKGKVGEEEEREGGVSDDALDGLLEDANDEDDPIMRDPSGKGESDDDKGWE